MVWTLVDSWFMAMDRDSVDLSKLRFAHYITGGIFYCTNVKICVQNTKLVCNPLNQEERHKIS